MKLIVHATLLFTFFQITFKPCFAEQHKKSEDGSTFYHYLPFGGGQFANGDETLGIALASSQVIAFGYHLFLTSKAESLVDDAQRKVDQDQTLPNSSEERMDEIYTYARDKNNEADHLYEQSLLFMGIFGALWIGGIVQGIIGINSNDYQNDSLGSAYKKHKYQDIYLTERSHQIEPKINFDFQPVLIQNRARTAPNMSFLFDLKLEF